MRIPRLLVATSSMVAVGAGAQGGPIVTRQLTIGCESCGGATQFGSIWDVAISVKGEILVTDRDEPMLRLFDATGTMIWTRGRKGKGPGEYTLPIRAAFAGDGMTVVDMTSARVTDLTDSGRVRKTTTVTTMPMAASVNARGELWIGNDNFRGLLTLYRRAPGEELREVRSVQGSRANVAIAVAPDGSIAAMLDTKKYELARFDRTGKPLPGITRDIAPVRRTPEEEMAYRERMNRARGMVAAEAKAAGGKPIVPALRPDELSFKDHLTIDGLRFDPSGRLWVHTQRGNARTTVFDVFSASGVFVGSVTVPLKITSYSLGGSWLVTGGEDEDGVPVVVVWRVG